MASRFASAVTNLDRYQCMFTWYKELPYPFSAEWVVNSVTDKLRTPDCEWQAAIYHFVLCHEKYILKKDSEARDHLTECESIISNAECFASCPLIVRNIDAMRFVLNSSWLHLVAKKNSYTEYKDCVSSIGLYKNMSKKQKAGVLAIHAACLMEYGTRGTKIALQVLELPLKNDEREGHWHYLRGKALQNARLVAIDVRQPDDPSEEELKSFEQAVFHDGQIPSHSICLAATLYETVKKERKRSAVCDQATELYKSALEKWPNSPYVNLMCASGLLLYAYPVRDTKLIDKVLLNSLKLAPSSAHVNYVAGVFFKWPNKNPSAAESHFRLACPRFADLVDEIKNGNLDNYRTALVKAFVATAPIAIMQAFPEAPAERSSDDDSNSEDENMFWMM